MKKTLAENMLRFGTKNLPQQTERTLIVKSIMETINEYGVHKEVRRRLMEQPAVQGASLPASITLNYANGFLREMAFFKGSSYLAWDMNATFKGANGALTISEITFVPGEAAKEGSVTQVVPLLKPFSIQVPMDAGGSPNSAQYRALGQQFATGIKLNVKSPAMAQVIAGGDPKNLNSTTLESVNIELGTDILAALYYYCGEKGWYTGPKKAAGTQYVIFTNHGGESQNV